MKVDFTAEFDIEEAKIEKKADTEEGERILEGYASTADLDKDYTIIDTEVWQEAASDLLENPTVLYNHDTDKPIGRVIESTGDDKGLRVKARLAKGTDGGPLTSLANDIWALACQGVLSRFSIRGSADRRGIETYYDPELGREVQRVKKLRLYEVSVVAVPSNSKASFTTVLVKALQELKESDKDKYSAGGEKEEMEEIVTKGNNEDLDEVIISQTEEEDKDTLSKEEQAQGQYPPTYPRPEDPYENLNTRLTTLEGIIEDLKIRLEALELQVRENLQKQVEDGEDDEDIEIEEEDVNPEEGQSETEGRSQEMAEVQKQLQDLNAKIAEVCEVVKSIPVIKGLSPGGEGRTGRSSDFRKSDNYKKADPSSRLRMSLDAQLKD